MNVSPNIQSLYTQLGALQGQEAQTEATLKNLNSAKSSIFLSSTDTTPNEKNSFLVEQSAKLDEQIGVMNNLLKILKEKITAKTSEITTEENNAHNYANSEQQEEFIKKGKTSWGNIDMLSIGELKGANGNRDIEDFNGNKKADIQDLLGTAFKVQNEVKTDVNKYKEQAPQTDTQLGDLDISEASLFEKNFQLSQPLEIEKNIPQNLDIQNHNTNIILDTNIKLEEEAPLDMDKIYSDLDAILQKENIEQDEAQQIIRDLKPEEVISNADELAKQAAKIIPSKPLGDKETEVSSSNITVASDDRASTTPTPQTTPATQTTQKQQTPTQTPTPPTTTTQKPQIAAPTPLPPTPAPVQTTAASTAPAAPKKEAEESKDPAENPQTVDIPHENWQNENITELKKEIAESKKEIAQLKAQLENNSAMQQQGQFMQNGQPVQVVQQGGTGGGFLSSVGNFLKNALAFPFKLIGNIAGGVGNFISNLFNGNNGGNTATYAMPSSASYANGYTSLPAQMGNTYYTSQGNSEPGFFSRLFGGIFGGISKAGNGFTNFIGWNEQPSTYTFNFGNTDRGRTGIGRTLRSSGEFLTLGMAGDLNGDGKTDAFSALGAAGADIFALPINGIKELFGGLKNRWLN